MDIKEKIKKIIEKKFDTVINGYSPSSVDSFLDSIIKDFESLNDEIEKLKSDNEDLKSELKKMAEKIINYENEIKKLRNSLTLEIESTKNE